MRRCLLLVLPVLLLLPLGCKKSEGYNLAKVSGKVTVIGKDGKETALAGALVTFTPKAKGPDGNTLPPSYAETRDDGSYTLMVEETDPKKPPREGAVVGEHKVTIDKIERGEKGVVHLIPETYNKLSNLTFTVTEDGATDANFKVDMRK
jgi:hypothetical protein